MKGIIRWLKDSPVAWLALEAVKYLVVGIPLVVLYVYLVDQGFGLAFSKWHVVIVAIFLLPSMSLLYVLHVIRTDLGRRALPGWVSESFWAIFWFFIAPLLASETSYVATSAGLLAAGEFIFRYRYESALVALFVSILVGRAMPIQLFIGDLLYSRKNMHKAL